VKTTNGGDIDPENQNVNNSIIDTHFREKSDDIEYGEIHKFSTKNITNIDNNYTSSYYKTDNILQSKIYLTKDNFYEAKKNESKKNSKKELNQKEIKNIDDNNRKDVNNKENLRYLQNHNDFNEKDEKEQREVISNHTRITKNKNNFSKINNSETNINNKEMDIPGNLTQNENVMLIESNIVDTSTNTYQSYILIIKNFNVVENDDYLSFKKENEEIWGKINYILKNIQRLFRKLNFINEEIDSYKLLNIVKDELTKISNRDLISLMSERSIKLRGFKNKKTFHLNLKEAFVLRIQSYFRMFKARKYFLFYKNYEKKVRKIQKNFRLYRQNKLNIIFLEKKRKERYVSWRTLMNDFKRNWSNIKKEERIEIHINSYGMENYKNASFEKFNEKQNNQINRIISLKDPKLQIIYICPFEIGTEVLSYYFSILSIMGVENAKERFHLVIPVIDLNC